jgi:hypothetical protein
MDQKPKPGETLQDFLARVVPQIVQAQGVDEKQAQQIATDMFKQASASSATDKPADQPGSTSSPADGQAKQPAGGQPNDPNAPKGDKPMNWDQGTWGTPISQQQDNPQAATADPTGSASSPAGGQPAGVSGDLLGWFKQQIASLGNVLLDRLVNDGVVPPDQRGALQQALAEVGNSDGGSGASPNGMPIKIEVSVELNGKGDGSTDSPPDPTATPDQPSTDAQPDPMAAKIKTWMGTQGFTGPVFLRQAYKGDGHDLSIKSLSADRIGSYLCVWGSPFKADLVDEFFTPHTKGLMDIFNAVGKLPAIYHHALDRTLKSAVIGLVDTMQPDDVGMWVEAQITQRSAYEQMIKPLIQKSMLGWSSGALPGGREVNKATGEITYWPIAEASMTPTPMEWRMSTQWPIGHIKAAYQLAGLPDQYLSQIIKAASADRYTTELALEQERIRILSLTV